MTAVRLIVRFSSEGSKQMTAISGVPLCDLSHQFRELGEQFLSAAQRVLQSGQVIGGPELTGFEQEAARYCNAKHGIGCSSGSDALLLALAALDIGPGDEVILPPFTFFATVGAVSRLGATPVFADIEPDSFNLDPARIEEKITVHTRAILVVHLFGQCAEMNAIRAIARKHQIRIVEDSAQAIGAEYHSVRTGTLGDMACFSFYPSKNLGAYGDAGLVVTDDADLAAKLVCLRNHGMEPRYHHKIMGWNARLDAIQAAFLRVKLPHLDTWTAARQQAAQNYDRLIQEQGLDRFLTRPTLRPNRRHVFNQYVIRIADGRRDALLNHLKANKIGCEIYYPIPLHLQECLLSLGHQAGDFPVSEAACDEVLAVPMFPEITLEQQRHVVQSMAGFLQSASREAA